MLKIICLFGVVICAVFSHSHLHSHRSIRDTRKITHLSDGSPAERLIIIDGKIFKEIKELKSLENGEFELTTRLERQNMELVNERIRPQEPEKPKIPEKPKEKLDIRAHWFAPGGQPEFPKLVYSLNYGWKEVYDEEDFRELKITYTAPWGMPGLRWIEVPYTSTMPESRTKVAIPSAFVSLEDGDAKENEKMVPVKKVHLRAFAADNDGGFVNIPKNTPEIEEKPRNEVENGKPKVVDEPKDENLQGSRVDDKKNDEENGETKPEFIFKNSTTTLGFSNTTTVKPTASLENSETEKENDQKIPLDEKQKELPTSKATSILGELVGSRTDTCPPITVRGEESEPLYWIVRAHPCNENPVELAKVFTTEDGKAFAYYGRPELVSLKKNKLN